nr:uncharacterized protein LOC127310299 [Lolium perenne]
MTPTFQGRRPGVPARENGRAESNGCESATRRRGNSTTTSCATTSAGARSTTETTTYGPHGRRVPSNSGATDGGSIGPGPCAGPHEDGRIRSRHANRRHGEPPRRRLVAASSPAKPGPHRARNPRPRPSCLEDAPPAAAPTRRNRWSRHEHAQGPPRSRHATGNGRAAAPYAGGCALAEPRPAAPPPPLRGREGPPAPAPHEASPGDALEAAARGREERWGREELRRRELPGRSRERLRS